MRFSEQPQGSFLRNAGISSWDEDCMRVWKAWKTPLLHFLPESKLFSLTHFLHRQRDFKRSEVCLLFNAPLTCRFLWNKQAVSWSSLSISDSDWYLILGPVRRRQMEGTCLLSASRFLHGTLALWCLGGFFLGVRGKWSFLFQRRLETRDTTNLNFYNVRGFSFGFFRTLLVRHLSWMLIRVWLIISAPETSLYHYIWTFHPILIPLFCMAGKCSVFLFLVKRLFMSLELVVFVPTLPIGFLWCLLSNSIEIGSRLSSTQSWLPV